MKKNNMLICGECGNEAKDGLREVRDFRGHSFTVCCITCEKRIDKMLDILFRKYGGIENKCSCRGSPVIHSVEHLQTEIA